MSSINDPETFWLVTTNVILGLVVLACIIVVARGVYQEVRNRISKHSSLPATENRALVIPLVGPTMADGGEPIDSTSPLPDHPERPKADKSQTRHSGN